MYGKNMGPDTDSNAADEERESFDEEKHEWQVSPEGKCDLRNKCITDFPLTLLSACRLDLVVTLELDHNSLSALPDALFTLVNLKHLSLTGNELRSLNSTINSLVNLESLHVNENSLYDFPDSVCDLAHLKALHAQSNMLKVLPHDFHKLAKLEELILDENKLVTFPEHFGLLPKLVRLDVGYNKLESLPESFGSLVNLRNLDLSSNKALKFLPDSFGDLPNVRILDIAGCSIRDLPEHFASAPVLQRLSADENELCSLPSWIGAMAEMEEFTMKSNFVRGDQIDDGIGHVSKKLKRFNVCGNLLESLPNSFSLLSSLEEIDLGSALFEPERKKNLRNGNNITKLPPDFGVHFANLHELRIDECGLDELPSNFGEGLPKLAYFDSHCNNLSQLPDSFCKLIKLQTCVLSMNDLCSLPANFGQLVDLKELRLENNHLVSLPPTFDGLISLQTLDLYGNNFDSFPNILQRLCSIRVLDTGISMDNTIVRPDKSTNGYRAVQAALKMGKEIKRAHNGLLQTWALPSNSSLTSPERPSSPSSGSSGYESETRKPSFGAALVEPFKLDSSASEAGTTSSFFDGESWDTELESLKSVFNPARPYEHEPVHDPPSIAPRGKTIIPQNMVLPCDRLPKRLKTPKRRKLDTRLEGQFDDCQ